MYLEQEVLPTFNSWVNSMQAIVNMKEGKKLARFKRSHKVLEFIKHTKSHYNLNL